MDFIDQLREECILFGDVQNYIYTGSPDEADKQASVRGLKRIAQQMHIIDDEQLRNIYHSVCSRCVNIANCKLIRFTHRSNRNVIVNKYRNGEVEVIWFADSLKCIDEAVNVDVDHSPNYIELDGMWFPKEENLANAVFLENTANSLRQSADAFWGYALSNEWDYFVTLTTDKCKVDRFDDDAVKALWTLCRKKLQRFDPDVKILLVAERHKNGALHFHGLVATNKPFTLRLHMIKGVQQYSSTGAPLFEFPFWNYGIASCALINTNDYVFKGEQLGDGSGAKTTSQRRVVAYLSKYMGKQYGQLGYKKKHFYRTRNVVSKEKSVENWKAEEMLAQLGAQVVRSAEGSAEPFDVTMNKDSRFYVYDVNKQRIIFRSKFVHEERKVMGVLIRAAGGIEYRALEELEEMKANGCAEAVGENHEYKYFKEVQ